MVMILPRGYKENALISLCFWRQHQRKKKRPDCIATGRFWFLRSPANTGEATNLTLGVLRTLARLAQTDLLTLNLTGIAGHKTSTTQGTAQRLVILH